MADMRATLEGVDDVLAYYASLKGIPLADVLRHAAKDIAYTAYKNTPSAKSRGRSRFALLPGKGSKRGRSVVVSLDAEAQRESSRQHRNFKNIRKRWKKSGHLARLNKYRLAVPAKGFARSLFIPLFKAMGFKSGKGASASDSNAFAKYSRGFAIFASASDPYPGSFKSQVEAFRSRHMSSGESFSAQETSGDAAKPRTGFSITQPALSSPAHADWEQTAASLGFARAGAIIARDLRRCLQAKRPDKETITQ